MARRRMFNGEITECDPFYEMPSSSQALYFHMGMVADDLGIVSSPKTIMKAMNASEDDIRILLMKNYLLPIGQNLMVVRDWLIHNTIRWDRFTPTVHTKEFLELKLNGKQYSLTDGIPVKSLTDKKKKGFETIQDKLCDLSDECDNEAKHDGNQMATSWQPNGNQRLPQSSLLNSSIVKLSLSQSITDMTSDQFLALIHNYPELVDIDIRLFTLLKDFLNKNHKEDLNVSEYVKFIYDRMKLYNPKNYGGYFYNCILDIESVKRFEKQKNLKNASIKMEIVSNDTYEPCPACGTEINVYDDCPVCKIRRSDMKNESIILLQRKYFNLDPEVKAKYDDEETKIYESIPFSKSAEREQAKSELNRKFGLI